MLWWRGWQQWAKKIWGCDGKKSFGAVMAKNFGGGWQFFVVWWQKHFGGGRVA